MHPNPVANLQARPMLLVYTYQCDISPQKKVQTVPFTAEIWRSQNSQRHRHQRSNKSPVTNNTILCMRL